MCMCADFPEIRKSQSTLHQTVSQSDRWAGGMMSGLSWLANQIGGLRLCDMAVGAQFESVAH